MPSKKRSLLAASGSAGESVYVEDVFSTYLYTGTGADLTITNDIDLDGEGGLVWIKNRTSADNHVLVDTVRGANKTLASNNDLGRLYEGCVTAFYTDGFKVDNIDRVNASGENIVSWTFRKAEKFFDVVTYTGTGVARTQTHNLGSVPACIIVKRTDAAEEWKVYHVGLDPTVPEDYGLELNKTGGRVSQLTWNNTAPTDSVFSLSQYSTVNGSGATYVAYLFASDAGGFGDDGSESVIKCGEFTAPSGSASLSISLGWEAQYVLFKKYSSGTGNWSIFDINRGMPLSGSGAAKWLKADDSASETGLTAPIAYPNADGFVVVDGSGVTTGGEGYIYIAIRRPMKTPESGTEVFMPTATSGAAGTQITTGFASDLQITKYRPGSDVPRWADRLRGFAATDADTEQALYSNGTGAEVASGDTQNTLWNTGFKIGGTLGGLSVIYYSLKRAAGFMDVVAYTGTGANTTQAHNLGVAPEMIIVKVRSTVEDWRVYHSAIGATKYIDLNKTSGMGDHVSVWNDTAPTSSVFTLGTNGAVNGSGQTYISYLFATLAGVSKVGSYTGTAATLNVDCGFSAGARFILIKRTDDLGDWYTYDSARGISAGNDPWYRMNSNVGEVTGTDYIDPLASGFTVTSNASSTINVNGGTYIFLSIA